MGSLRAVVVEADHPSQWSPETSTEAQGLNYLAVCAAVMSSSLELVEGSWRLGVDSRRKLRQQAGLESAASRLEKIGFLGIVTSQEMANFTGLVTRDRAEILGSCKKCRCQGHGAY